MAIYRCKFVQQDTIAYVPAEGYGNGHDNYSKKSIQYLEWESLESGRFIQHALNYGEHKIPGTRFKADGYHETDDGLCDVVYEFYG